MRQSERLIINVLSNYGQMAIEIVASLVVLPVLVRQLGRDGYGLVAMILTMLGIFEVISVSLSRTLQRYIPKALAEKNDDYLNRVFNTTLAGFIILGILGSGAVWFLREWLLWDPNVSSALLADSHRATWLLLAWLAIGFPLHTYSRALEAIQRYDLVAVYATAASIVRSIGLLVFFCAGYGSITVFVIMQLGSSVILVVGSRRALRKQLPQLIESPSKVSMRDAIEMSRFTAGALLMLIGNLCATNGYRLLVGKMLGMSALGALGAVQMVTNKMWQLIFGMASTLTPAVSSMEAAGRQDAIGHILISGTKYSLAVAASMCLVPLPIITPLFELWLGKSFEGLGTLLIVSMFSQILITIGTPPQLVVTGLGRVHFSGVILLSRGVLSLIAGWLFVVFISRSLAGSVGCVGGVQAIGGYMLFLYSCHVIKLPKWRATLAVLWPPMTMGFAGLAVTWIFAAQLGTDRWWSILVSVSCGELVFAVLLMLLGLSTQERVQMMAISQRIRSRMSPPPQALQEENT